MKTIATLICIASMPILCGCSSEPTSDTFRNFATGFEEVIEGDKDSAVLTNHDLSTTNSLTVPLVGTAHYEYEFDHIFRHPDLAPPEYSTTARFQNRVIVKWGWIDGSWQLQDASKQLTGIVFPGLPADHYFATKDWAHASAREIPIDVLRDTSNKGRFSSVNGWAVTTHEEIIEQVQAYH